MTAKRTDGLNLKDARLEIKRRGREIGSLKRRAKRLEDAEILMKRHERRWKELERENESLNTRMGDIATVKAELTSQLGRHVGEMERINDEARREAETLKEVIIEKADRVSVLASKVYKLGGCVRDLLGKLSGSWRANDLLRTQLAGAEIMPDGRASREHTRDAICKVACEVLEETAA